MLLQGDLTSSIMAQYTMGNGPKTGSERVKASSYGKMAASMKGIGRTIKLMVMED